MIQHLPQTNPIKAKKLTLFVFSYFINYFSKESTSLRLVVVCMWKALARVCSSLCRPRRQISFPQLDFFFSLFPSSTTNSKTTKSQNRLETPLPKSSLLANEASRFTRDYHNINSRGVLSWERWECREKEDPLLAFPVWFKWWNNHIVRVVGINKKMLPSI